MKQKHILRKIISITMLVLIYTSVAVEIYLYITCHNEKMEYMKGFLIALPLIIAMYWFSTFFTDLSVITTNVIDDEKPVTKRIYLLNKIVISIFNWANYFACAGSMIFWIYTYINHISR